MLRYQLFLVDKTDFDSLVENLDKLQWFYSPVGTNIASGLALSLLVCGTGTYWMWQGWQRRFPNPSATVLSKRQSYLLVICCRGNIFRVSHSNQTPQTTLISSVYLS